MKKSKIFWLAFLSSMFVWWSINITQKNAEDFLVAKMLRAKPQINVNILAEISSAKSETLPEKAECDINKIKATNFLTVLETAGNKTTVISARNENLKTPIASLTKLLTFAIAQEYYPENYQFVISKQSVEQPEELGRLKVGEIFSKKDLSAIMLMESSNDAAFALSEPIGGEGFVNLMNLKAENDILMGDSYFYNPTGLDPNGSSSNESQINYSTANDLAKLMKYVVDNYAEQVKFLGQKEYPLGRQGRTLKNTNMLAGEVDGLIAGKTGYTERANGCLIMAVKAKNPGAYFIYVILDSPDRFNDMEELIKCSF